MPGYRLAKPAVRDLDSIWLNIAVAASTEIANRTIDRITNRFPILASHPEIGQTRNTLKPSIRGFPAEGYMIYYRQRRPAGIDILRVINGKRDQRNAWSNGG